MPSSSSNIGRSSRPPNFWGVNPGFEWKFADNLKLDAQANWTESNFHRESPTVVVITPASSGVTVNYTNDGGIPQHHAPNIDLNNPANFGWTGGRVNIQDERRAHRDQGRARQPRPGATSNLNLHVGGAYDDVQRTITRASTTARRGRMRSAATIPASSCRARTPSRPARASTRRRRGAGYPTYPALGTGFTAGQAGPVTYRGSLIPQTALATYLRPGPDGFVTVDWDAFRAASQLRPVPRCRAARDLVQHRRQRRLCPREDATAPMPSSTATLELGGNRLRYNVGVRYVEHPPDDRRLRLGRRSAQRAPIPTAPGRCRRPARRGGNLRDGSCYPNIINFAIDQASLRQLAAVAERGL